MRILIYYSFTDEQIESFRRQAARHGDHEVVHAKDEEEAIALAPGTEVILGNFSPEVCGNAPELRWIQVFSAGMDKFLFPEIIENDVVISNMAGIYASQGGEHAWAMLLGLTRGIVEAAHSKDRKEWKGGSTVELAGGTVGVIGLGGFGMEIAKRAAGYSMTVIALDTLRSDRPEGVDELKKMSRQNLEDLLKRSDVVMIGCPLTDETYHLIGSEELALMKDSAYLINVTRGGIVDEPALAEALEAGTIAGAGLDVCEKEPLPEDSPLWDAPNLILTAHRAGASQHRPRKIFEFFTEQLERYLTGETPVNIIDKRLGY